MSDSDYRYARFSGMLRGTAEVALDALQRDEKRAKEIEAELALREEQGDDFSAGDVRHALHLVEYGRETAIRWISKTLERIAAEERSGIPTDWSEA